MENTNVKDIAALAVAGAGPNTDSDTPFVLVPQGYTVESLERFQPYPPRKRGKTILRDADSFVGMVKCHFNTQTSIYGQYSPPSFTAVFNDHAEGDDGAPGWKDHSAVFDCPLSVEWKTWIGASGAKKTQEEFASFIEDNLPDIAQPPAADMLEISRTLEAKKKVNFASGIRLANGQNQLTYEEEISGTASRGQIQVPEEFTIGIPVLEGGPKYAVTARLRYRIADGGKMIMWYELVRPHKILEDAVKEVWAKIENDTGLKIFNGSIAS